MISVKKTFGCCGLPASENLISLAASGRSIAVVVLIFLGFIAGLAGQGTGGANSTLPISIRPPMCGIPGAVLGFPDDVSSVTLCSGAVVNIGFQLQSGVDYCFIVSGSGAYSTPREYNYAYSAQMDEAADRLGLLGYSLQGILAHPCAGAGTAVSLRIFGSSTGGADFVRYTIVPRGESPSGWNLPNYVFNLLPGEYDMYVTSDYAIQNGWEACVKLVRAFEVVATESYITADIISEINEVTNTANIRITYPVGPSVRYRLNGSSWQAEG